MPENDSHLRCDTTYSSQVLERAMVYAVLQGWLIQSAESQIGSFGRIATPVLVFVVWYPKHCPGRSLPRKPFLQQTAWQVGVPLFAFHDAHRLIHSFRLMAGMLIELSLPELKMV